MYAQAADYLNPPNPSSGSEKFQNAITGQSLRPQPHPGSMTDQPRSSYITQAVFLLPDAIYGIISTLVTTLRLFDRPALWVAKCMVHFSIS